MSEEKDNIVKLRPDLTKPENFDANTRDEILIRNRDEMLEFLEGMKGRVMAFDIRGIVAIGFSSSPLEDVIFESESTGYDVARTVGCLEFVKQKVIHDCLAEQDEE